jgi:hypothetical protein
MEGIKMHRKLISAEHARQLTEALLDHTIEGISKHIEMAAKEGSRSVVCNINGLDYDYDAVIAILTAGGYSCAEHSDPRHPATSSSQRYFTIFW